MSSIKIGDIVKHYNKRNDRFGIVIAIDKHTIFVDWFNREGAVFVPYPYYSYALVKVSE